MYIIYKQAGTLLFVDTETNIIYWWFKKFIKGGVGIF